MENLYKQYSYVIYDRENVIVSVMRWIGVIILMVAACQTSWAQKQYTIRVPTYNYILEAKKTGKDPNSLKVLKLINEIAKYKNLSSSIDCMEKINPILEDTLKSKMKKIKEETPYILAINWNTCEFISLRKDNNKDNLYGSFEDKTTTIYRINLYPELPTEPIIKKDVVSASKKPLLATYQNEKGDWVAMGPYMTTDGFATENQAIGSLFYSNSDLRFLGERGKFKIYELTIEVKHDARDIRYALKQLGVNEIPE
jgi:hypothetical protein